VTVELIERLDRAGAFAPTRRFDDLDRFHVPFDQLFGDTDTEARLRNLVTTHRRVAVCAQSGEGKSSVISSVVGPLALDPTSGVLPIRIPVGSAPDATVTTTEGFLRHLLGAVLCWSDQNELSRRQGRAIAKLKAELQERQETCRGGLTLPLWFISPDIAREVSRTVRPFETYSDHLACVRRVVEVVGSWGRHVVFVLDDADGWLRSAERDRTELAAAFFSGPFHALVREMGGGLVIALHDDYLDMEDVRRACEHLDGRIELPRLDRVAVDGLRRILERRVSEVVGTDVRLTEVMESTAIARLAEGYRSGLNLRAALRVAATALEHGQRNSAPTITDGLMELALAQELR